MEGFSKKKSMYLRRLISDKKAICDETLLPNCRTFRFPQIALTGTRLYMKVYSGRNKSLGFYLY